jgi:hypothetical protein
VSDFVRLGGAMGAPGGEPIHRHAGVRLGRLKARGVVFRGEPTALGSVTAVAFEDTCGNLINLVQPPA